jgi:uncharacterized protein YbjT (DUF2867 family)
MRVFVAGASGALGSRLVPKLIEAGHEVIGTHHSPASAQLLQVLGAEPVQLDLLDTTAVRAAVLRSKPDAIVHQATALAAVKFGRVVSHRRFSRQRHDRDRTRGGHRPARAKPKLRPVG